MLNRSSAPEPNGQPIREACTARGCFPFGPKNSVHENRVERDGWFLGCGEGKRKGGKKRGGGSPGKTHTDHRLDPKRKKNMWWPAAGEQKKRCTRASRGEKKCAWNHHTPGASPVVGDDSLAFDHRQSSYRSCQRALAEPPASQWSKKPPARANQQSSISQFYVGERSEFYTRYTRCALQCAALRCC